MPIEIPKCSSPEGYNRSHPQRRGAERSGLGGEGAGGAPRLPFGCAPEQRGAKTEAERECLEAISPIISSCSRKHDSPRRIPGAPSQGPRHHRSGGENSHEEEGRPPGYRALEAEGMLDMAFEAVVLEPPELFSADAVKVSQERMAQWQADKGSRAARDVVARRSARCTCSVR